MTGEKSDDGGGCGKFDFESQSGISWEVLLKSNNDETCGGVLVSKQWILTNAECGKSIISSGGSVREPGITDLGEIFIKTLLQTVRESRWKDLARVIKNAFQKFTFILNMR